MKQFLLVLFLATTAFADQLVFKNGDRITGSLIRIDEKIVQFKGEIVGEIKIPRDQLDSVSSTSEVAVIFKDGRRLTGKLYSQPGDFVLESSQTGLQTARRDSVAQILSPAEFHQLERMEDPGLFELWKGSFSTGLAAARGNTDNTSFSLGLNADRITRAGKLNLHGSAIYARNNTTGVSTPVANAIRGGFKYDLNIQDESYLFLLSDLDHDMFQKLDLRTVVGAGGGHHAIKNARTTLDLFGGGTLNRENFSTGLNRNSAEGLGGEEFSCKVTKNIAFREKVTVFPNLSDLGEYRVTLDSSAITAINRWIGWQTSVSNLYLSNPIQGTTKNDLTLTTGFRFSFAR